MEVDIAARVETYCDTEGCQVGVHLQDNQGICVSLHRQGEWVHLSWEVAEHLAETLLENVKLYRRTT